MIKLKTNDKHRMGVGVILPIVGEVTVSQEGYIQVDTREKAENLVASGVGFYFDETSFVNHLGSEEELVGENETLKAEIVKLTNEKTELNTNLKVSEDRVNKLSEQFKDASAKLESAKAEILSLRAELGKTTDALKDSKLGFKEGETPSLTNKKSKQVDAPSDSEPVEIQEPAAKVSPKSIFLKDDKLKP